MEHIQTILTALAPMLTELLAIGLSLLLGMVMLAVRKYFGLMAEAILRDALGQAIETGAAQAPRIGVADAAAAAVDYAKRSSPGTIKELGVAEGVLLDKARAAVKRQQGLI